jgi:hypothetical protein
VQHHAGNEAFAELVSKPREVPRGRLAGSTIRLDLDGDDARLTAFQPRQTPTARSARSLSERAPVAVSRSFAAGMALGAAAEVPTGGASTVLIVASWSSFVMGATQCANGLVRVGAARSNLDGDSLSQWDRNTGYAATMLIVDAIGVTGALTSLPFAVRNAWAVVTRMRAFANMDLTIEGLRRLNRVERFKVLGRVFQEA